jgi:hypothetical protein
VVCREGRTRGGTTWLIELLGGLITVHYIYLRARGSPPVVCREGRTRGGATWLSEPQGGLITVGLLLISARETMLP